jgi:hypothetical protein
MQKKIEGSESLCHWMGVTCIRLQITPFSLRMVQGMVDIRHGTNDMISKCQVIQTPTHVGDLMVESASNDGDVS